MRKNRGAFFENNANTMGFNPGPMGFQANNYSSFYAGPNNMNGMPNNMNAMVNNMNPASEIEERLAKIERAIQRLDARVSKIEGMSIKSTDDFESTTNNMYIL